MRHRRSAGVPWRLPGYPRWHSYRVQTGSRTIMPRRPKTRIRGSHRVRRGHRLRGMTDEWWLSWPIPEPCPTQPVRLDELQAWHADRARSAADPRIPAGGMGQQSSEPRGSRLVCAYPPTARIPTTRSHRRSCPGGSSPVRSARSAARAPRTGPAVRRPDPSSGATTRHRSGPWGLWCPPSAEGGQRRQRRRVPGGRWPAMSCSETAGADVTSQTPSPGRQERPAWAFIEDDAGPTAHMRDAPDRTNSYPARLRRAHRTVKL